jgi:hypothetical protein
MKKLRLDKKGYKLFLKDFKPSFVLQFKAVIAPKFS